MRVTQKDWPAFLAVTATKIVLVSDKEQYTVYDSNLKLYGLTWWLKRIFISTRYFPDEEGTSEVIELDRSMQPVGVLPVKELGGCVHEVFAWEGLLFICDAGRSSLKTYNLVSGHQRTVQWPKNTHLNCFWKFGDLYYALEHRHKKRPKALSILNQELDVVERLPIYVGPQAGKTGWGVHNIYIQGGKYITLGPYSVYETHKVKDEAVTDEMQLGHVTPGEHFLRGLAAIPGRNFLVGVSHLTERSDRGIGDSRVLLTDVKFKVLDEVVLKDVGQILSIRLLRGDAAHNSRPCPYQPIW